MPRPESFKYDHKELLKLLIEKADIHDGRWMLQVFFGSTAGNFGVGQIGENNSDGETAIPGFLVTVQNLGITRAPDGAPDSLVLDAAEVNPA